MVELLLKRLPEAAHVKAVMLYVHGPMDSTPLRRHAATHIQSRTWRMNMPYALAWEKDALKHLLVAEFEHRKRMALDAIVPVTYLNGEPHQWSPVDIAEHTLVRIGAGCRGTSSSGMGRRRRGTRAAGST